ncbi:ribulose-phosphate 3-epimerase [Gottschalkiaceae bacterium SANA]|nr:ribulose-phosphate 3-epimerase [Gottschalkiaceae bacterium SANA]
MAKIAPSILSADFAHLAEDIEKVERGGAEYLHIDVMDGQFVPNITMGPPVIKSIRACTEMFLDVHLMIDKPERYIEEFAAAGADLITFHVEATPHAHRVLQAIHAQGCKAGIVLNPGTSLDTIEYLLPDLDLVLLMSVNPGFGGQSFIPQIKTKIQVLRDLVTRMGLQVEIQVDGGVNRENILELVAAGADVFVMGSAIFNSENPEQTTKDVREMLALQG